VAAKGERKPQFDWNRLAALTRRRKPPRRQHLQYLVAEPGRVFYHAALLKYALYGDYAHCHHFTLRPSSNGVDSARWVFTLYAHGRLADEGNDPWRKVWGPARLTLDVGPRAWRSRRRRALAGAYRQGGSKRDWPRPPAPPRHAGRPCLRRLDVEQATRMTVRTTPLAANEKAHEALGHHGVVLPLLFVPCLNQETLPPSRARRRRPQAVAENGQPPRAPRRVTFDRVRPRQKCRQITRAQVFTNLAALLRASQQHAQGRHERSHRRRDDGVDVDRGPHEPGGHGVARCPLDDQPREERMEGATGLALVVGEPLPLGRERLEAARDHGADERFFRREVAVNRARADFGPARDFVERDRQPLLREGLGRDLEHPLSVAPRVGTEGPGLGRLGA
jgi:hypothetical protein